MRNLPRVRATCHKGINQDTDQTGHDTCADARNVWAPDGRVVQRPGYVGVGVALHGYNTPDTTTAKRYVASEDVSTPEVDVNTDAGTVAPSSFVARQSGVAGDAVYLGFRASDVGDINWNEFFGFQTTTVLPNSNDVYFLPEYWNGTQWQYLYVADMGSFSAYGTWFGKVATPNAPWSCAGRYVFVPPGDWAAKILTDNTFGGSTDYNGYWIRLTLLEATDTAFDAAVAFRVNAIMVKAARIYGMKAVESGGVKRYISFGDDFRSDTGEFLGAWLSMARPGLGGHTLACQTDSYTAASMTIRSSPPASFAVVPEDGRVYAAFANLPVCAFDIAASPADGGDCRAGVEDRELYVGTGAPYDKDVVIQLGEFPKAQFILYHKRRLWVTGIDGEPFTVRWTGQYPYHKVWPAVSWEAIEEDDNSKPTALFAHGDHTCVSKRDSIWLMRDKGLNALDLREYDAECIVRGVGVASNASVRYIRGRSVFLADDGIYAFDGTPSVQKLSDRIQDYINRITPGSRSLSSAAHWRSRGMYLLGVPLDGSTTNSHVLAWDYVNDAWWVWDIPAQAWLEDDDALYFATSGGHVYELGKGRTDNGTAIDAWYETHEIGDDDFNTKRCRCVRLAGSNNQGETTCELRPSGQPDRAVTATVDFSDYNETNRVLGKRFRRPRFKSVAEFFTVKIRNAVKADELEMSHIDLEYQNLGER